MTKGLFITFEGPDGSGKSTQIELLRGFLAEKGYEALLTREPGGTRIGEMAREIVLDKNYKEMSPKTEMLLYAAARAQHTDEVIRPALESGRTVISDRYMDSSLVYQGYGRGLGEAVEKVNAYATEGCVPDATFLLKLNPSVGMNRIASGDADRIERESLTYHDAVYEGYLELERKYPDRIIGLDATHPPEEIHQVVRHRIESLLNKKEAVQNDKT
jgi:dTMP kinase